MHADLPPVWPQDTLDCVEAILVLAAQTAGCSGAALAVRTQGQERISLIAQTAPVPDGLNSILDGTLTGTWHATPLPVFSHRLSGWLLTNYCDAPPPRSTLNGLVTLLSRELGRVPRSFPDPRVNVTELLTHLTAFDTLLDPAKTWPDLTDTFAALLGSALSADLIVLARMNGELLWASPAPPAQRVQQHWQAQVPWSVQLPAGSISLPVHTNTARGEQVWHAVRLPGSVSWDTVDGMMAAQLGTLIGQIRAYRHQREQVQQLQQYLNLALTTAPLLLWVTDPDGTFQVAEGRGMASLGLRDRQLVGRTIHELFQAVPRALDNAVRAQQGETVSDMITFRDRTFEAWYLPLASARAGSVLGIGYDVTEVLQARQAAERAQLQAETLLSFSRLLDEAEPTHALTCDVLSLLSRMFRGGWAALWTHEPGWFRLQERSGVVPASLRAFQERGLPDGDTFGRALLAGQSVFIGPDRMPGAVRMQGLQAAALLPVTLDTTTGVLILTVYRSEAREWTEFERDLLATAARNLQRFVRRRHMLTELHRAAGTDPLTGVGNRRAFEQALAAALLRGPFTLVSTDLDGLKHVNDSQGHPRGDALLRAFAQALQTAFRAEDQVFRLGGDEFSVIMGSLLEEREVLSRVEGAVAAMREAGFPEAAASAGVADTPRDGMTGATLIQVSDARMYDMKRRRQNTL